MKKYTILELLAYITYAFELQEAQYRRDDDVVYKKSVPSCLPQSLAEETFKIPGLAECVTTRRSPLA